MTFDSIASYNRGLHHFGLIGKPDVDVEIAFVTDTKEQIAILTCRLTNFVMSRCAN